MLRCTIQIFIHVFTLCQQNSYQHNHSTSSDIATPQPPSLSYSIIPAPLTNIFTPSPPHPTSPPFHNSDSYIPSPAHSDHGNIPQSGSRSSMNILQWSWHSWIALMKLIHCLYTIHKLLWFPLRKIIPHPLNKILQLILIHLNILNTSYLIFCFTINFHRGWRRNMPSLHRIICDKI